MKLRDLVPDVWEGKPITIRNLYSAHDLTDALDIKKKVTPQTVFQYSQSGSIIGKRTVIQR